METNVNKPTKRKETLLVGVVAVATLMLVVAVQSSRPVMQRTFESPVQAGNALQKAARSGDPNSLVRVLGGEAKVLITTGEPESDKAAMDTFVYKYDQMNRWVAMSDGSRVLYIGADNFAFPVPLAKNVSGNWYFDAVAGSDEIRARQIGRNELLAIDACYAIANAEELYFTNGGDSPAYAQRIISTTGKQDGLYWPASASEPSSPLGQLSQFPKASLASLAADQPFVIDGYTLRILTAQGEGALNGAQNYIVDGKMNGGFAIVATPLKYGETGIMTFMISREGIVYERDFGPDTAEITGSIHEYDPDDDWSAVN